MSDEFERVFEKLYCKNRKIKPKFFDVSFEGNFYHSIDETSSRLKVRYRTNGEPCQTDVVSVGTALDMLAKRILELEDGKA